jgi:hypothetical protein
MDNPKRASVYFSAEVHKLCAFALLRMIVPSPT